MTKHQLSQGLKEGFLFPQRDCHIFMITNIYSVINTCALLGEEESRQHISALKGDFLSEAESVNINEWA